MKMFFAVLAGLFIFSRLQQGQGIFSGSFAAPSLGSGSGEIPYGGAAGIISAQPDTVYPSGGSGGVIGSKIVPTVQTNTFQNFTETFFTPPGSPGAPQSSARRAMGVTY